MKGGSLAKSGDEMNWQTPIAALAGILGVAIIVLCYVFVWDAPPTVQHVDASSPVLTATTLSQAAEAESSPAAEPRLPASYDNKPDFAETSPSQSEAMLQPSDQTVEGLADVPSHDAGKQAPLSHSAAPKPLRPTDHRANGLVTSEGLAKMKADLQITKDQMPDWLRLVAALKKAGKLQSEAADATRPSNDDLNGDASADLRADALPLLNSLSNDQMRAAGKLSGLLGFKSLSAMADTMRASTAATAAHKQPEPRVVIAPAPPVAKPPVIADPRYEGLLTKAEISRIKVSLKLTPNQEALWPPVAAILAEMGQQQMAQVDAGQKLDNAMSGAMAQRFYYAAQPLLQTLTEDQKAEVRRRARSMGLEAYASYL